jgi:hypothetical protein
VADERVRVCNHRIAEGVGLWNKERLYVGYT